jgi:glycosyltransferase involved in cell wall biosynthesis
MKDSIPHLSVVTPCFNEESTVEECVQRLETSLLNKNISFEHILVDNASNDRTLEVMLQLKSIYPHVRVLSNEFNIGAFKSMQRGIKAARGDLIIPFLAADCQDPPELIPVMLQIRDECGCNTVAGVRRTRQDNFIISSFRRLFYKIVVLATHGRYRSGSSEFRLMETNSASQLVEITDATPFLRIYMSQIQGEVEYIEYEMAERKAGKSSSSFFPLVDDALNGIMLAMPSMFSRLLVPLVPLLGLSFSLLLIGALCVVCGYSQAAWVIPWSGASTALIGLLTVQMMIGQYVFMIHSQVRAGPTAFTKEL